MLLELLDLPARLRDADNGLTVICFDEFQDLLTADDRLDGLFRSVIQHHGRAAAYVYAGSRPSLMREMFSDHERPFYAQARPLRLPTLPQDETVVDLQAIFRGDGLDPGEALADIVVTVTAIRSARCCWLTRVALADGMRATGQRAAREHATSRSSMQRALDRLAAEEQHVVRDGDGPRLLDPLLAEWLRRR